MKTLMCAELEGSFWKTIHNFCDQKPPLRFTTFYLLIQSHKYRSIEHGQWKRLCSWATTAPSVLLTMLNYIILRLNLQLHLWHSTLKNSSHFVTPLQAISYCRAPLWREVCVHIY